MALALAFAERLAAAAAWRLTCGSGMAGTTGRPDWPWELVLRCLAGPLFDGMLNRVSGECCRSDGFVRSTRISPDRREEVSLMVRRIVRIRDSRVLWN